MKNRFRNRKRNFKHEQQYDGNVSFLLFCIKRIIFYMTNKFLVSNNIFPRELLYRLV
jgi:hypothetical protein